MSLVLDTSVTIARLFAAERTEAHRETFRRVVAEGAVVPSLWRLEVANVLGIAVRRGRCDESYARRCLERLASLDIAIDAETDTHAWGETRRLAAVHELTIYDAAYLELAIRRALPLASCDAALLRAARNAAVAILD